MSNPVEFLRGLERWLENQRGLARALFGSPLRPHCPPTVAEYLRYIEYQQETMPRRNLEYRMRVAAESLAEHEDEIQRATRALNALESGSPGAIDSAGLISSRAHETLAKCFALFTLGHIRRDADGRWISSFRPPSVLWSNDDFRETYETRERDLRSGRRREENRTAVEHLANVAMEAIEAGAILAAGEGGALRRGGTAPGVGTVAGPIRVEGSGAAADARAGGAAVHNTLVVRFATREAYEAALMPVFPGISLNPVFRAVDEIGDAVARRALADTNFVALLRAGDVTGAGTRFHRIARDYIRNGHPGVTLPSGWTIRAEEEIAVGGRRARADLVLRSPQGTIVEIDWKTTGRSGMESVARMDRRAGLIRDAAARLYPDFANRTLTVQESRSYTDYLRPLVDEHNRGASPENVIPWPSPW